MSLLAVAAIPAGAQHLSFQDTRLAAGSTPLIEAAAAPQRFAFLLADSSWLPAPAPVSFDEPTTPTLAYSNSGSTLPDDPSAQPSLLASVSAPARPEVDPGQFNTPNAANYPKSADGRPIASLYTKYIPAGWAYQPIHGKQKLILGLHDLYTPTDFIGMIASAGYSHVTNAQPNYGTDRGAFGERLGAAAIRQTAQSILTDGVFSVLYHQDPRYFTEGPKYNVVHRALYAATRPLIVRTNDGKGSTINASLLSAYATVAVLNNAYYPASNRNVHDTLASYGGSIGGATVGYIVAEFTDDALEVLHLKHKP